MLALVKNGKGGTADALRMAEHAIGVEEAALGRDHVETTRAMHNLGLVRLDRGEFNDAFDFVHACVEIRRRTRADNKSVADSLDLVALSLIELKRFDEARNTSPKPCPFAKRTASRLPRAGADARVRRPDAPPVGPIGRCGPPVERSISLAAATCPGHPDVAAALQILGNLRYLAGDAAGASRIWIEARSIVERSLGRIMSRSQGC